MKYWVPKTRTILQEQFVRKMPDSCGHFTSHIRYLRALNGIRRL